MTLDERYEMLNENPQDIEFDDHTEACLTSIEGHLEDVTCGVDAALWNVRAALDTATQLGAVHLLARLAVLRDALEQCAIDDCHDEVEELRA